MDKLHMSEELSSDRGTHVKAEASTHLNPTTGNGDSQILGACWEVSLA